MNPNRPVAIGEPAVVRLDLGPLSAAVTSRLQAWQQGRLSARIWQRDHTVWASHPVPELVDRLGWLTLPETMGREIAWLEQLADGIRATGCTDAVLLGMGGSSLAPELFQATFGNQSGCPALRVLDSTHPVAVARLRGRVDPRRAVVIVSSKSGTTVETQAGLAFWWEALASAGVGPGPRVIAITDPGTRLEAAARDRGFRAVVSAPPDVGGRYSALSVFGLVPAAIIGAPVEALVASAARMADACGAEVPAPEHPGLVLGACLAEAARAGRDKLVLLASPGVAAFPAWLEQLIAESTGKEGRGIVPVDGEAPDPADLPPADRIYVALALAGDAPPAGAGELDRLAALGHPVVRIAMPDASSLGAEMFRWEFAVAAASAALGVQPFDQPDVQLAKDLARRAMSVREAPGEAAASRHGAGALTPDGGEALNAWLASVAPGDYVAIQAFLAPTPEIDAGLLRLRRRLAARTGSLTSLGIGPRFLHSTGQLHKGGPAAVCCLQLIDDSGPDVAVPEAGYTFRQLIDAQAAGDAEALRQRGRRLLRVTLGRDPAASLERLFAEAGA